MRGDPFTPTGISMPNRLFVTLTSSESRTISVMQPGRERPPNWRWGEGQGPRGGVAHVPAALRDTLSGGRDRRRIAGGVA